MSPPAHGLHLCPLKTPTAGSAAAPTPVLMISVNIIITNIMSTQKYSVPTVGTNDVKSSGAEELLSCTAQDKQRLEAL